MWARGRSYEKINPDEKPNLTGFLINFSVS